MNKTSIALTLSLATVVASQEARSETKTSSKAKPTATAVKPATTPVPPAATAVPATGVAAVAGTIESTASPELVGLLAKQVGVTPKQAEGGAGAILGFAKGKLKVSDYAKVAAAVPGCENLIKAAPVVDVVAGAAGATGGGALGGAVSAIGGQVGGAAGLATSVAPAFQKLGLSTDTIVKFVPIVVQFASGKGGSGVGDLLGSVLK